MYRLSGGRGSVQQSQQATAARLGFNSKAQQQTGARNRPNDPLSPRHRDFPHTPLPPLAARLTPHGSHLDDDEQGGHRHAVRLKPLPRRHDHHLLPVGVPHKVPDRAVALGVEATLEPHRVQPPICAPDAAVEGLHEFGAGCLVHLEVKHVPFIR
eukprot:scaffold21220_cov90-Isochrysis_galbana.AAC.2